MQINIFHQVENLEYQTATALVCPVVMTKSRGLDKIDQYMNMDDETKQLLVDLFTLFPKEMCNLLPVELINVVSITVLEDIMREIPTSSVKHFSFDIYSLCVDYFNRPLVKVMTTHSEMILIGKFIKWFKKHKVIIETTELILAYLSTKDIRNVEIYIKPNGAICNFRSKFCMYPELILVECLATANAEMAMRIIDQHTINFNLIVDYIYKKILNPNTTSMNLGMMRNQYCFNLKSKELCPIMQIIIDNTSPQIMLRLYSKNITSKIVVKKIISNNAMMGERNQSFVNQLYCVSCAKYLYNSKPSSKTLMALSIAMYYSNDYEELEFVKKSKFYNTKSFLHYLELRLPVINQITANHPRNNGVETPLETAVETVETTVETADETVETAIETIETVDTVDEIANETVDETAVDTVNEIANETVDETIETADTTVD